MPNKPTSVEQYLAALPEERRAALSSVRDVIRENLGKGFEEGLQYGMIGYYVPHAVYPPGYHTDPKQPLPFASLASQKGHMAVYLMGVYGQPEQEAWFRQAWARTGKKLDMGQSCVRFKKLDDVALDVLGEAIRRVSAPAYIAHYEAVIRPPEKKKAAGKSPTKDKPAVTKAPAAKKPAAVKKAVAAKKHVAAKSPAKKAAAKRSAARPRA